MGFGSECLEHQDLVPDMRPLGQRFHDDFGECPHRPHPPQDHHCLPFDSVSRCFEYNPVGLVVPSRPLFVRTQELRCGTSESRRVDCVPGTTED